MNGTDHRDWGSEKGNSGGDAQERFDATGKNLRIWLEQSKCLHRAAYLLAESKPAPRDRFWNAIHSPVALMLGAYAIETLLKMVIVGQYIETQGLLTVSRHAKDFVPTTHDLLKLSEQAKLRTNAADRKVLKRLSRYSIWAGRYPTPLVPDGSNAPFIEAMLLTLDDPIPDHPLWHPYHALYHKLHAQAERKALVFGRNARRKTEDASTGPNGAQMS
jgi:hypothetical protein